MRVNVIVNDRGTRLALTQLSRELGNKRRVYSLMGKHFRDYVRQTVHMGGRHKKHAPLSIWTKKRTGRNKPFTTIWRHFDYRVQPDAVLIYHMPHGEGRWNITMHHKGYVTPTRWGRPFMVIPMKRGWREMGVSAGDSIFLRKAGPSVIPPREIWPTRSEANREAQRIARQWLEQIVRERGLGR